MRSAFTPAALLSAGFQGFQTIAALRADRCSTVPLDPGVYAVLRMDPLPAAFLTKSPGGWFKGKDPTVDLSILEANWVERSPVIYIGKADELQRRLRQYVEFGAGRPVGHWGGRLIWQLSGSADLQVAWRVDAEPLWLEAGLIHAFVDEFGEMPFANLRR